MLYPIKLSDLYEYATSGSATLHVKSLLTNNELHFKIRKKQSKAHFNRYSEKELKYKDFIYFVYASENNRDWYYLCCLKNDLINWKSCEFYMKSNIVLGFNYIWKLSLIKKEDERLLIWHDGICGKCGRLLTDEVSVSLGIGPTCRGKR